MSTPRYGHDERGRRPGLDRHAYRPAERFVNKLSDSIDSGVGRLVDADMNEESTRLKALQTQQQLAIQSLSIANSASENVLTLFR